MTILTLVFGLRGMNVLFQGFDGLHFCLSRHSDVRMEIGWEQC